MPYSTIARMTQSVGLLNRIAASAAQEGLQGNALLWANDHIWTVASAAGWALAWESAEADKTDNENPDTGMRNDVITDGMILAVVQPMVTGP